MNARTAQLVAATAAVGAVELLVLRVLTRTAVHIPGLTALVGPYTVLATAARFAYYVAAVLLVLSLLSLSWDSVRRSRAATVAVAACVAAFAIMATLARAGLVGDSELGIASAAAIAGIAVVGVLELGSDTTLAARASLALFAAAFVLSALPTALALGEILFLLWCVLSPLAAGARPGRAAATVGVLVAALTLVALRAAESTVKVLLLWNLGLVGYLPDWLYAAALGAFAFTLAARPRAQSVAALALLVIGGVGLHSTYQTGMALLGLAALTARRGADATEAARRELRPVASAT